MMMWCFFRLLPPKIHLLLHVEKTLCGPEHLCSAADTSDLQEVTAALQLAVKTTATRVLKLQEINI